MIEEGKLYPEVLGVLGQLMVHTKAREGPATCHLYPLSWELQLEGIQAGGRQWGGGIRSKQEGRPVSAHTLGFPPGCSKAAGTPSHP